MANFPTSLDTTLTLPNPTGTSTQASPDHAALHTTENVALIAVETKLGIGASTPSSTNLLVSTGTGTSAWSKLAPGGVILGTTDSQNVTNKSISASTWSGGTIDNTTITTDAISGHTTSNTGTIFGMSVTVGILASAAMLNQVNTAAIQTNAVTASKLSTDAITLGYTQITSNFTTVSTTPVQVTGLTTTVTIPAGGRRIKITVFTKAAYGSTSNTSNLTIWDGTVGSGTQIGAGSGFQSTGANSTIAMAIVTPAAGSKTYNAGFNVATGTGTWEASTTGPSFILVEAI